MDAANDNVFTQPPRPLTSDPEWNKGKEVDNGQEQTWFNDMLSTKKALLTFDELITTPIDFSNFTMNHLKIDKLTKAHLVGLVYELLKGTCQSSIELEYNIEECYKALSDKLDWNNPKGDRCPFDLSKPLPLKGYPGHLTVASEYFFNNDLEYLKSPDPETQYTMSITKTKAARYESQLNIFSRHDVYSSMKILSVKSVTVNKLHGYGYLEEIVVKRADRQFYSISMVKLLLTWRWHYACSPEVSSSRREDVQLGMESYQKKLNITKPQKDFPRISVKELYTPSFDPPRIVYADSSNRKRLMRADELYKFSDGTLKKVRDTLHHRLLNFRFGYSKDMSRRKWSATDKKRARIMVDLIDKLMLERRILRNLERLVGAWELEMDYRLMQRTV
ncbi:hypothetical protein Tco_0400094 [Tanacetum coccineum]